MSQSTPLERVRAFGPGAAHAVDLLAAGLTAGPDHCLAAEQAAKDLLARFGGLRGLEYLDIALLVDAGLPEEEAVRTLALLELGRRIAGAGQGVRPTLDSPDAVAEVLSDLRREKREHFVALLVDAKNVLLRRFTVHIGTLSASIVGPREVFREAIREGASAMIVAHNHPSGDPTPSPEDIDVTEKLVEIGKMLDIPVLDHIIVGERRHVSLRMRGVIR